MIVQNKIRPGAYIDFESVEQSGFKVGSRGIVTFPLVTEWGVDEELTTITYDDLINGVFKNKFGNTDTLLLELALLGCEKVLLYTINKGDKAGITLDGILIVTAKYSGEYGNKIAVGIKNKTFITYLNGEVVVEQKINTYEEIKDNEYVTFEIVEGEDGTEEVQDSAYTFLSGGTKTSTNIDYDKYLNKIKTKTWNTLAVINKTNNEKAQAFIKNMREKERIKVQCVIVDDNANYEGTIKLIDQSVKYKDIIITSDKLTVFVAGITAGAKIEESNTGRITPFTEIIDEMTNTEIEEGIKRGYFLLTYRADKNVKCEYDINSFTNFTPSKSKDFSKNKIIRIIDEISNTIKTIFENNYSGKISNSQHGRDLFKTALITYFNSLLSLEAIDNFAPSDITVLEGEEKDSILVKVNIKPVDAVEKLYMLVVLR